MADTFTKAERSDIMRKVKSVNTSPEYIIRKHLHKLGFRFRLHQKKLPGSPDIVLPKYRTVINVNGCFWHGHENCKRSTLPEANHLYWEMKIQRNKLRDQENIRKLSEIGWNVINIFECELTKSRIQFTFKEILETLSTII
jgi:DNA mismatch endonuclease (patch repair protein)